MPVDSSNFVWQRRRELPTIPIMLLQREVCGMHHGATGFRQSEFSSRVAWNTTRLQNTILSVGPGTPASVLMVKSSSTSSEEDHDDVQNETDDDEEDEEEDEGSEAIDEANDDEENERTEQQRQQQQQPREEDDDDEMADREQWLQRTQQEQESAGPSIELAERALMEWMDAENENDDGSSASSPNHPGNFVPSIRHGGCINTATWLTSPWRLSLASQEVEAVSSHEGPTQLLTSGDDRTVKFWDVSYAMGTANPLPGGKNSVCPFSSYVPKGPPIEEWKSYHRDSCALSGSVIPLATLQTRHRGNVFHATPLDHAPGKVVTCGADGYLRMSDLETSSSVAIFSPEFDRDHRNFFRSPSGFLSLRPGMCFSHHFIDSHAGLLCSERGLRHFDIRIAPREQRAHSILGDGASCKACAVWSADSTESAYVFAGGASANVSLYDLRMMTDGSSSKIVQQYRPRGLSMGASVSVSGLDLTRDQKELLVSYENDQIYTFPIFPNSRSAAGPTVDEVAEQVDAFDDQQSVQSELAAYGAHLNRFTFLKNAKYAGPRDEYICTGSDSGHAWIYEKATGGVAAFLNADHSTCNGVVPHPNLPMFITYGIDSTAKLWRATLPLDAEVDDSPMGRACFDKGQRYEKSPIVNCWNYVQTTLHGLAEVEDQAFTVLPDEVPMNDDSADRGLFTGLSNLFFRSRRTGSGHGGPYLGNDLHNLPYILRQNLFSCIQARENGDDEPIRSSLEDLRRRISLIRLRHQADCRGLMPNASIPWLLKPRKGYLGKELPSRDGGGTSFKYGDPVALVPSYPSDWLPYDPEMTKSPRLGGMNFNMLDYTPYCLEYYGQSESVSAADGDEEQVNTPLEGDKEGASASLSNNILPDVEKMLDDQSSMELAAVTLEAKPPSIERATQVLLDTVSLLKNAGNKALKDGLPCLAARHYDTAIRYCAMAFIEYPHVSVDMAVARPINNKTGGRNSEDVLLTWSPLLKVLIALRLNLSLVLLKPRITEPKKAAEQAMMALLELDPFCREKGKVKTGKDMDVVHSGCEPLTTFTEAKEFQAKAYFRLATAQCEIGDHKEAARNFDRSIKSTRAVNPDAQPDQHVLHRLADAKRESMKKSKRQRKKFKAMFGSGLDANETTDESQTQMQTEG